MRSNGNFIGSANRAFTLVVLLTLTGTAIAVDLANKPLSTAEYGWNSNINGADQQAADDLTLTTSGTANKLTWYGFSSAGETSNNFRVRIFQSAGAQPADVPFYDQVLGLRPGTDTGLDNSSGISILQYSSAIPAVALTAGTKYWLMIASTDSNIWAWSHAVVGPAGNDQYHRDGDGSTWRSLAQLGFPATTLEQSFRLEGVVPEPASITVIGCGACLFVASRRRRQRARESR
jgi:hypothetical protein